MMKGLYNMLGLEYRDTDSEDEGPGGSQQNKVIQITDAVVDDEDRHSTNSNDIFMDWGEIYIFFLQALGLLSFMNLWVDLHLANGIDLNIRQCNGPE